MERKSGTLSWVAVGLLIGYALLAFGLALLPAEWTGTSLTSGWARLAAKYLMDGSSSGWIHTTAGWLALLAAGVIWTSRKRAQPRWLLPLILSGAGLMLLPLLFPGSRPRVPSGLYDLFWPRDASGWPILLVVAWLLAYGTLLFRASRPFLWLATFLSYLMMAAAALGVASNFLKLNLMYDQPLLEPIPGSIAVVLFILAVLLLSRRQAAINSMVEGHSREDRLISVIGLGMLVIIAFFTGLFSFMALQSQEEGSLYRAQLQSLDNRIIVFYNAMESAIDEVAPIARNTEIIRLLTALNAPALPVNDTRKEQLLNAADAELPFTVDNFAFRSIDGTVIAQRGQLTQAETIWVEYRDATEVRLSWSNGIPFIGMTVRINDATGLKVGELVVELPTSDWEQLVTDTYDLGSTGNMMICGVEAEVLRCLESRRRGSLYSPPDNTLLTSMIQDALEGERSSAGAPHIALDERGKPVMVTYGPVGKVRVAIKAPGVGLAMLILTDAEEFYEPIRVQLHKILPLLLVIIIIGFIILRRLVVPLILALRDKEARFRALTELSSDWYWEMDTCYRFSQISGEVERKGGFSASDSLGRTLWEQPWIMPDENDWTRLRGALEACEPFLEYTVKTRDLQGATRYLAISGQPFYDADHTLVGFRGTGKDVTEKRLAEEHIQFLAHYDSLTQLPNRAFLGEQLRFAIERAKRHRKKLALLFIDLDRFKAINDSLGHDAGDEVLRIVARRIAECVRDSDLVSRLGGDEFVVLLEDLSSPEDAGITADRILDLINQPFQLCGAEYTVGTSIGISLFPDDGDSMDDLLKNADAAMYLAKKSGRNGIYFFADVLDDTAAANDPGQT